MSVEQQIVDLDVSLEPDEVLRMMGGVRKGPVQQSIIRMVDQYVERFRERIRPRGVYTVCEVASSTGDRLHLQCGHVFEGQIAAFLEPAHRVAVFIVTIGEEIEQIAERRMEQGATLEGFTIDAIGSVAADAAADAMADHVLWSDACPGEAVTPPFSPGYCGMALEQQKTLFSILDSRPLGVALLPTLIMRPIKSVSGLVGIGLQERIAAHAIPCERCKVSSCKMRR
jgi:hypothetical protein